LLSLFPSPPRGRRKTRVLAKVFAPLSKDEKPKAYPLTTLDEYGARVFGYFPWYLARDEHEILGDLTKEQEKLLNDLLKRL
jgi:hypothetical protein